MSASSGEVYSLNQVMQRFWENVDALATSSDFVYRLALQQYHAYIEKKKLKLTFLFTQFINSIMNK